ncbi:MAG: transcription antitermination factor NusB [Spirochaetaceae bacterium]|nr:MAG: transcription antitermination factor NusB [Spirochaetaceae bacterium]
MGVRRRSRVLAFQALYAWDVGSATKEDLLEFGWYEPPEEETEQDNRSVISFAQLLVAGTLEQLETVDAQIKAHLSRWGFDRIGKTDLAILRISAYSLLYSKDIPASVTIDEAVEMAREFAGNDSFRFVNGVLDGISRDRQESTGT